MKFSAAFTALLVLVPLLVADADAAAARGRGRGRGRGRNRGGAANATAVNATAANATAANSTAVSGAANNTAVNGTAANNAAANNNNNDPQSSLTLDPKVIAVGFESDGQQVPVAGQVPSLTSANNFINFCLTVPNLPITNGKQIKTGSCNPAPMGIIASTANMPSSKFVNPVNGQDIKANTAFTIQMAVAHLETGNFVNAQSNYYAAPQQVNAAGDIIGHTHFTVTSVGSFTNTSPQDPNTFAFFKGVNGAAVNGVVSENVAAGLPAGVYRLCSMNTDANHAPALVAVAQHGTLDDCVYFSVGGAGKGGNPFNGNGNGNNGNGNGNGAGNNSTAAPPAAGNSTVAAGSNSTAVSSAAPAASGAAGNNNNKKKKGNGRNRKQRD